MIIIGHLLREAHLLYLDLELYYARPMVEKLQLIQIMDMEVMADRGVVMELMP